MFIDGIIHNLLELIFVVLFALFFCTVGGIIIGDIICLIDGILEKRLK